MARQTSVSHSGSRLKRSTPGKSSQGWSHVPPLEHQKQPSKWQVAASMGKSACGLLHQENTSKKEVSFWSGLSSVWTGHRRALGPSWYVPIWAGFQQVVWDHSGSSLASLSDQGPREAKNLSVICENILTCWQGKLGWNNYSFFSFICIIPFRT